MRSRRLRARRVRLVLDLIALADARLRGDLDGLAAACRRIPLDPAELAELGLAGWDLVRVLTLSNQGTAELWLGELDAAEIHLRAAMDAEPAAGILLPRLNAQAQLALLECERGHLTTARTEAREVVARATATGSTSTAQMVSAYLALALGPHRQRGAPGGGPVAAEGRRGRGRGARTARPADRGRPARPAARRGRPGGRAARAADPDPGTGRLRRAGATPRPQPARAGRARGAAPRPGAGEVRAGGTALARHPGGRRRRGRHAPARGRSRRCRAAPRRPRRRAVDGADAGRHRPPVGPRGRGPGRRRAGPARARPCAARRRTARPASALHGPRRRSAPAAEPADRARHGRRRLRRRADEPPEPSARSRAGLRHAGHRPPSPRAKPSSCVTCRARSGTPKSPRN